MTRVTPAVRIALVAAFIVLTLTLVPAAVAGKGTGGGGSGKQSGCTQALPSVSIDNNYAWAAPGSWGMPGQQLTYAIKVTNNDAGCGSSSFTVSVSAPQGFSVSFPTSTISLASTSAGYLWAYVTSPSGVGDGDYAVGATASRAGAAASAPQASAVSYYKVYSSDSTAPSLFWPNPWDGASVTGRSYTVGVAANDDHAVQKIELYIDGAYTSTTECSDISYNCQLFYTWRLNRVSGQHTIRFEAYDWMGNVATQTVTFTVG